MPKPLTFGKGTNSPGDSSFSFFLPLEKVKKNDDGSCTVSGYASTARLDFDDEIISLDAVKAALPGYWEWRNIREMHQASAVGVAKEANVDSKGLFLTSKITDPTAVQKCIDQVYKGYSIGGRKLAKTGNVVTEIELIEVSLVDRPANPDCKIELAKSAKAGSVAYLVKSRVRRDPAEHAVDLMAKAVRKMAKRGPPAGRDGFSLPVLPSAYGGKESEPGVTTKRDVKESERKDLAAQGKANPDGGFPIKDKSDLKNAVDSFGRAKNKKKTKKLIMRRAQELGATDMLPEKWSQKLAKREAQALQSASQIVESFDIGSVLLKSRSAMPSFLTLDADNDVVAAHVEEGNAGSSHEPGNGREDFLALRKDGAVSFEPLTKRDRKLLKRMGVAGSLAYCFDSIRSAQRDLMYEAKREGGDLKDKALAEKLGPIAQALAGVIGQKAEHEGAEALDFSDADDRGVVSIFDEEIMMNGAGVKTGNAELDKFITGLMQKAGGRRQPTRADRLQSAKGNLKKARASVKECAAAIKAAHAMHKAAYLAKAAKPKAKPPESDDFDHEDAMKKLQKAYGEVEKLSTYVKAAGVQLKKASGRKGQSGQEVSDGNSFYQVPAGIKDLNPSTLASASPGGEGSGSQPPHVTIDERFPGKVAKAFRGYISPEHAEALVRAAKAEATVEVLGKMPAPATGGRRPFAFDVSGMGIPQTDTRSAQALTKGVNMAHITPDGSGNESIHKVELGKLIGNMLSSGVGARPIMDPDFHGTAGLGRGQA